MTSAQGPGFRKMPFGVQYELTRQLRARGLGFSQLHDAGDWTRLANARTHVDGMAMLPSLLRSATDPSVCTLSLSFTDSHTYTDRRISMTMVRMSLCIPKLRVCS